MADKRISVDIDENELRYLRMCCLKLGVTLKEFVIGTVIEKVDEWEDKWMLERWEKDGTLEEIQRDYKDPNKTTFLMEKVDEKFLFTEMKAGKAIGIPHEI